MIYDALRRARMRNVSIRAAPDGTPGWSVLTALEGGGTPSESTAMKLSAVNACVNILSDAVSCMPVYAFLEATKARPPLPVLELLNLRPNDAMNAATMKKLLEAQRLLTGNGYAWIHRDPYFGEIDEIVPLLSAYVNVDVDADGTVWYDYTDNKAGKVYRLHNLDVLHYKAYSRDGITGVSVLSHAASVIRTGDAAASYEEGYYKNGAAVSGVLSTTDSDLSPEQRDAVRGEWERVHAGNANAFRIAVLDRSLKYQPIAISNRDSQFIESKEIAVKDIARFFRVPLYKLGEGKQAYSSNEQNELDFESSTILPLVTQLEQEDTYKLLLPSQRQQTMRLRRNMDVLLRADPKSRAQHYKDMREMGAYSVNDILDKEDRPPVPGGNVRLASLNYVPLEDFTELSRNRNGGDNT